MVQIPVYAFTGFLDSGKTKFIQETLEDERFNAGERTLLLVFEEGEEEYDFSTYPHKNVYLETLDQQTVTTKELQALAKKYRAERVVAELNGMQQVGDLYMRFPENWAVAQEVMFADSTTIMAYNANMRNLVMDKLVGAQMVVFNRLEKGADVMPLHKVPIAVGIPGGVEAALQQQRQGGRLDGLERCGILGWGGRGAAVQAPAVHQLVHFQRGQQLRGGVQAVRIQHRAACKAGQQLLHQRACFGRAACALGCTAQARAQQQHRRLLALELWNALR